MNNQKDQSVRWFIDILLKLLDDVGYVSKCSKATFLAFLDAHPNFGSEETIDGLIDGLLQSIKQLLVSSEEYDIWIKDYKINYTRNIEGFNSLSKIYQEYSVSHSPLFESVAVDSSLIAELLYLKFELQYRVKQDIPEVVIYTLKDYHSLVEFFRMQEHNEWVFRGQADKKWKLEPTILRNINREQSLIIDLKVVEGLYSQYGLLDQYEKIFGSKAVDYGFLSYMQHSTSYSPLIDFTKDFIIASSFALNHKNNINDFYNQDSAIFCMRLNGGASIESRIDDYKVGLLANTKTWSIDDLNTIYDGMGTLYKPYADISYSLSQANDRMKYQKGVFILYDHFISFPTNSVPTYFNGHLVKITLHHSVKKEIYDDLYEKHHEYRPYFLLNPYQYFSE